MSAKIRVLIVDDETSARRRIAGLLAQEADVEIVGESGDGVQACADIERLAPDLVFLDVEMPERGGLEVVGAVGVDRMPATIFATAHDRYAAAAYQADVMDYLLKPFDAERFARALAKARHWLRTDSGATRLERLRATVDGLRSTQPVVDRLLVRAGDAQQLLRTTDIVRIEADGNYLRLHTANGQFQLRERMIGILERLDPALFRRIHRSAIVNLDHVKKLLPWFGGDRLVIMADGTRLTLSRSFKTALDDLDVQRRRAS